MFGFAAVLTSVLLPIAFGSVFLFAWTVDVREKGLGFRQFFVAVFLMLWCGFMGRMVVGQIGGCWFLASLSPEQVERIELGGSTVRDASDVHLLVAALSDYRWYSPNHPSYERECRLRIQLQDGRVRRFAVATQSWKEGAFLRICSARGFRLEPPNCVLGAAYLPSFPLGTLDELTGCGAD